MAGEICVYCVLGIFGFWLWFGLILSIEFLVCFIHYKATGKNDWRYKYIGTKYEKTMFNELNYVLEHINDFEKVYDYQEQVYNFLDGLNIPDEHKEEISKFFNVRQDTEYVFGDYKIITMCNKEWLIKLPISQTSVGKHFRDRYITDLVENKLKEYKLIR